MEIAIGLDVDGPVEKTVERATQLRALGFTRMWSSQIFGPDTLTVLAIVGRELRDVDRFRPATRRCWRRRLARCKTR